MLVRSSRLAISQGSNWNEKKRTQLERDPKHTLKKDTKIHYTFKLNFLCSRKHGKSVISMTMEG